MPKKSKEELKNIEVKSNIKKTTTKKNFCKQSVRF